MMTTIMMIITIMMMITMVTLYNDGDTDADQTIYKIPNTYLIG